VFYYLPKFVLAVIVMNSVFPLVDLAEARHLWKVKKADFMLWIVAFIGTLFLGVLMGIIVAVGLSLVIVISESVRPQITILWRLPGTTTYRGMKQEKNGCFVPNVFICRIGSSMYFANASFVKDTLLALVGDVEDINNTEYLVLEMTPVVTIDSTAAHVLHDIVSDFRSRGIQVAFAMIGNRVDKTMRKAKLKKYIGEKWIFPNVNEAVQFCLKHQHAKKMQQDRPSLGPALSGLDLSSIDIGCSNEIGVSNDMDPEHTMVFITLVVDWPTFVSSATAVFKKNKVKMSRYQIEPLPQGEKHTYLLKSERTQGKLSERERERVKDDLESLLKEHGFGTPSPTSFGKPSLHVADDHGNGNGQDANERIHELERQVQSLQTQHLVGSSSRETTCFDSVNAGGRNGKTKFVLCGMVK